MKQTKTILMLLWLVSLVITGTYYVWANEVGSAEFGIGFLLYCAAILIVNTEK